MFRKNPPLIRAFLIIFLIVIFVSSCALPGQRTRSNGSTSGTPQQKNPTNTPTPFATSTQTPTATSTPTSIPTPASDEAAFQKIIQGNQKFSWALLQQAPNPENNLAFSTFSQLESLIMLSAGAAGDTLAEINKTMQIFLPQESLLSSNQKLVEQILIPQVDANNIPVENQFFMVNSIWLQSGYQFLPDYINTVLKKFHAGLQLADFAGSIDMARNDINQSIRDQTHNQIDNLIPEGALTNRTRLLVTNAVYFKSAWIKPFDIRETSNLPFKKLDGSTVDTPTMHTFRNIPYAKQGDLEAIELQYLGDKQSMVILLPAEGKFSSIQKNLTSDQIQEIMTALSPKLISLSIPRFRFQSITDISEPLNTMGMVKAFSNDADFSGMDGTKTLYLQTILQKALLDMNEAGTEAAAASVAVVGAKSIPSPKSMEIKVDRPFFFLIHDRETGVTLFMGRVTNPKEM